MYSHSHYHSRWDWGGGGHYAFDADPDPVGVHGVGLVVFACALFSDGIIWILTKFTQIQDCAPVWLFWKYMHNIATLRLALKLNYKGKQMSALPSCFRFLCSLMLVCSIFLCSLDSV